MRKTKLWIGIPFLMVLAISFSVGVAFGKKPVESSQDQVVTSSSDSFLKYYQFGQKNACMITPATNQDCLAAGNKQDNKTLLAGHDGIIVRPTPDSIKECVEDCMAFTGGDVGQCMVACIAHH